MQPTQLKLNNVFLQTLLCLIFLPFFSATANPVIQLTAPTNGTTYVEGDTVRIITVASNPGGAISKVEFYVNNVYIGSDDTAPYQLDWISTEGTQLLTTKAVIGFCKDVVSSPVQIVVKKNTAPHLQLTSPSSSTVYNSNMPVPLAANAVDTDGVISHVDFFVNTVLVGSDSSAPYTVDWKSIAGDFTIVAQAIDNKGAMTISSPVAITVYPPIDSPPVITLTSPQDGDYFLSGDPVTISATANDNDGTIASVEFFVNDTSVGIDDTPPYQLNWSGTPGIYRISASATDNVCVSTASDTIHISVTDPNAPPYIIQNISGPCTDSAFCLPFKAVVPVKDIIGYDLVVHYDQTKVQPTGHLTLSNDLITASYISYIAKNMDSLSEMHISVFLNTSAPANTTFKGIGQLFCVEFLKTTGFATNDSAFFTVTDLQESYANGVLAKQAAPGKYVNIKNTSYKGLLEFWSDHGPIRYNAAVPSQYLITNIHGTDANCSHTSATAVQPDLNGQFVYNISNGTSMQVKRDIAPMADVQPVINGMDVSLGYAVLLNDPSFTPTIYQMIALDVNLDGVISAGDLSQMNQRSIKTILEFKQKWNYNNNGSSNGQASKDWLFINEDLLSSSPYKISATYPANDGSGFSKYKVPAVPFCLKVPSSVYTSCTSYQQGILTGVLLGDVNGNYATIPADGQIKRPPDASAGSIYLDLSKVKTGNAYLDVPVFFTANEKVLSLDFSIQLSDVIRYSKVVHSAGYLNDAMANEDDEQVLRFTSNSRKNYTEDQPVAILRFNTFDETILADHFRSLNGYLNGELVPMEIRNSHAERVTANTAESKDVQIYPNPTGGLLHVAVTERSTVQLLDIQGKELFLEKQANAGEKLEISTDHLKNGTYLLKIDNGKLVHTQHVVIER